MNRHNDQQHGVVAVILSLVLVVLLGFAAINFKSGAIETVSVEVQAMVDNTAHAAAALCSTQACWENSRAAALAMLASSSIYNIDLNELVLTADSADSSGTMGFN